MYATMDDNRQKREEVGRESESNVGADRTRLVGKFEGGRGLVGSIGVNLVGKLSVVFNCVGLSAGQVGRTY